VPSVRLGCPAEASDARVEGQVSALRRGAIAALAAATALAVASPAAAYDAGPHAEVTRDAMTAEGFGDDATGVAEVNNWFVDLYRQAQATPFSGHAGFWKRLLAGAIQTEAWSDDLVDAAYRSHFAITPTFSTTDALAAEWTRLQRAVWTLVREARDQNDPAKLLAVLGMSLHQVQDFYTHSNWVEPKGRPGADGPGWRERGLGSSPTWFDVPAGVRDEAEIYASDSDGRRAHGYWNTDGNHKPDQRPQQGLAGQAVLRPIDNHGLLRNAPVDPGGTPLGR
jgi:hypothetical protein